MATVKERDQRFIWVPPQSDTDARVPTAQEMDADSRLALQNLQKTQTHNIPAGIAGRPIFTAANNRGVVIPANLPVMAPGHPNLTFANSDVTINLPALADTSSVISRYDRIYLAVVGVRVTGTIDPDINFQFRWRQQNNSIQVVTKENTQRQRTAWILVATQGTTLSNQNLIDALTPSVDAPMQFTASSSSNGTAVGSYRIYALDPTLAAGAVYHCMPETLFLIDLLRVWRAQNHPQGGYLWGRNGEPNQFDPIYHFQPTYRYIGPGWQDWQNRAQETLRRIMVGQWLPDTIGKDRLVQNLLNGQVGANLDAPGLATQSPNGSVAIANNQRITFTNEAVTNQFYCLPVVTADDNGNARATVPFQGSMPTGTTYTSDPAQVIVYDADGNDVTLEGTITGLGGTGSLTWLANVGSSVSPGDTVYVVTGISYPAGSGLAAPGIVESVYLNAVAIHADNVREAANDLTDYVAPSNNEEFIVIVGRERAAVHYIYRKLTITSDANGIVRIPSTARGVIAFISGPNAPTGRQNLPVIAGLDNNTAYDVLVYHPPQTTEQWQVQLQIARYAGTGERSFVDGSRVATKPICFAHTQGGATSVFQSDGEIQFEAIGFRLPCNTIPTAVPNYNLNARIQFVGEGFVGQVAYREIDAWGGYGLALPRPGQTLSAPAAVTGQGQGFAATLSADGVPAGIVKQPLVSGLPYQIGMATIVEKNGDRRLLVATSNEGNPTLPHPIRFATDSPHYAALDTFRIY